jgi:hypothetical protein
VTATVRWAHRPTLHSRTTQLYLKLNHNHTTPERGGRFAHSCGVHLLLAMIPCVVTGTCHTGPPLLVDVLLSAQRRRHPYARLPASHQRAQGSSCSSSAYSFRMQSAASLSSIRTYTMHTCTHTHTHHGVMLITLRRVRPGKRHPSAATFKFLAGCC